MIVRRGKKFCIVSHTTGKTLGCYSSLAQAKKRLQQIQFFKQRKGALQKLSK